MSQFGQEQPVACGRRVSPGDYLPPFGFGVPNDGSRRNRTL